MVGEELLARLVAYGACDAPTEGTAARLLKQNQAPLSCQTMQIYHRGVVIPEVATLVAVPCAWVGWHRARSFPFSVMAQQHLAAGDAALVDEEYEDALKNYTAVR
jgi:hypothetical protein